MPFSDGKRVCVWQQGTLRVEKVPIRPLPGTNNGFRGACDYVLIDLEVDDTVARASVIDNKGLWLVTVESLDDLTHKQCEAFAFMLKYASQLAADLTLADGLESSGDAIADEALNFLKDK